MSAPLAVGTVTTGLPAVDEARAPAAVRDGSSAVKQAYSSAQGFEEMLMQQLSQSMLASSGLGGEGSGEGEAGSGEEGGASETSGALSSLLPQALTEGVMRDGGLGLASQLLRSLDPAAAPHGAGVAGTTAGIGAMSGGTAVGAASGTDTGAASGIGVHATAIAPDGGLAAPAATSALARGTVGLTGGVAS